MKNIILIGFMGSGKTTVGLNLSYLLKTPVEDTDKLIEAKENRKISDIFAAEGEAYFRDLETELLREISKRKYSRIISLGGGTPVREINRSIVRECGTVFYLRCKPETIYNRLKGDTTRPLLQCENPLERIKELIDSRREAYEDCAEFILDVDDMSVSQISEWIADKVK